MSGSSGAHRWLGGSVGERDVDALVDATLGPRAGDLDPSDLTGVGDVGAAVRLKIESDDLDGSDLLNGVG
jgi:hypothetical protein